MTLSPKLIRRLIGALIALGALWYFVISPAVMRRQVTEEFPTAAAVIAQEPDAMKTAMADATPHAMDEPMPSAAPAAAKPAGPVLKARGDFYNVVHDGKGKAEVFELPDGSRILRLEDFQVLNGPDLHVYLAAPEKIGPAIGVELPGYLDLGKLKGNSGAQNYPIPASADLSKLHSAVIWCQPFKVPFIAATLS